MSKKVLGIIGVVVLVALGWMFVVQDVPMNLDATPITIGAISARTGVGAPIGEEQYRGVLLAVEEINAAGGINGRPLELIHEDLSIDRLKDAGAVAHKLVAIDQVVAIVGPQWDEPAMAILPITEEAKVPMIGPDTSDMVEVGGSGEYMFSTWYDNRSGVDVILQHAQSKGMTRIAIMRAVDAGFWKFISDDFESKAAAYGIEIVEDITLGTDAFTTDFRTAIAKVGQKNPDAILAVTTDPVQCPLFTQLHEQGFDKPVFATESAGNNASLTQCPGVLENLYFSTPVAETEAFTDFEEAFATRFGQKPAFPSAVTAYDAVYVLARALEETDGVGGEDLRDALAETVGLSGASQAVLTFKANGFVETPQDVFRMKTVRNGEFVEVE